MQNGEIDVGLAADSKKQSSDRYVCEIFYARVKQWEILQDTARWSNCVMLDDAWHIAVASTDNNAFLRQPNNLADMAQRMSSLCNGLRRSVRQLVSQWPAGCGALPSYLQMQ